MVVSISALSKWWAIGHSYKNVDHYPVHSWTSPRLPVAVPLRRAFATCVALTWQALSGKTSTSVLQLGFRQWILWVHFWHCQKSCSCQWKNLSEKISFASICFMHGTSEQGRRSWHLAWQFWPSVQHTKGASRAGWRSWMPSTFNGKRPQVSLASSGESTGPNWDGRQQRYSQPAHGRREAPPHVWCVSFWQCARSMVSTSMVICCFDSLLVWPNKWIVFSTVFTAGSCGFQAMQQKKLLSPAPTFWNCMGKLCRLPTVKANFFSADAKLPPNRPFGVGHGNPGCQNQFCSKSFVLCNPERRRLYRETLPAKPEGLPETHNTKNPWA